MKLKLNLDRARVIGDKLLPYLAFSSTVLDIGAGNCRVAQYISDNSNSEISAIDTLDYNKTNLPIKIYDGKKLPYNDKSFDASLLVFVLHHAQDLEYLLKEAMRVTKNQILVIEDTPANKLEEYFWEKIDYKLNHAKHDDILIAHETKTPREWSEFFESQGLKVENTKKFRHFALTGGLYPHTLFLPEKTH